MRLEQLQAFLSVAETGSFQKAAQECGVTQSTVSRQIQGLEDALGSSLFHRAAQTKLTVAGEQFLPHAKRIWQEWQGSLVELAELRQGKQQELCIAVIHSVCAHYLPPVLRRFSLEHPQIQLRVTSLGSDRAIKVLRDGLVDLAIVMSSRFLPSSTEWAIDELYEEPIEVLLSAQHPLAQYPRVPWAELVRYPQVIFKDGYGMQRLVRDQFLQQGAELRRALELNTLDAFRGIVRQGDMIALLPQSALVECRHDPSLTVRPTQDPILSRRVVLMTTQDRLQIPPIRSFRESARQLIPAQVQKLKAHCHPSTEWTNSLRLTPSCLRSPLSPPT